jgi:excisionase family DNA binding protein
MTFPSTHIVEDQPDELGLDALAAQLDEWTFKRDQASGMVRRLTSIARDRADELRPYAAADARLAHFVARVDNLLARQELTATITVQQLAEQLGLSRPTVDRLLAAGRIPGARRNVPGLKGSPWLIPADAAAAYTRQETTR